MLSVVIRLYRVVDVEVGHVGGEYERMWMVLADERVGRWFLDRQISHKNEGFP